MSTGLRGLAATVGAARSPPASAVPPTSLGRDLPDSVVVPAPLSGLLLSVLPPAIVDGAEHPNVSAARRRRVDISFREGVRIRSPLDGIRAKRWLIVARAALKHEGLDAVRRTLTTDAFLALEAALVPAGKYLACPDCSEIVTSGRLAYHQATNSACRWRRAVREVRRAWTAGWRDPFSIDGAPLTWSELTGRVVWRSRLRTIPFPRWTAVLLATDSSRIDITEPDQESHRRAR